MGGRGANNTHHVPSILPLKRINGLAHKHACCPFLDKQDKRTGSEYTRPVLYSQTKRPKALTKARTNRSLCPVVSDKTGQWTGQYTIVLAVYSKTKWARRQTYRTTYLSSIPRQNGPLDWQTNRKESKQTARPHYLPSIATHRGSVDIQTTLPAVYCHTQRVSGYPDHITCRLLPHIEGQWISRPHCLPSIAKR